MLHLTLQQSHSAAWFVVAIVALALTVLGYRRVFRWLRPRQWWALCGLRCAAIGFVLLLLFRPVLSLERPRSERPVVVIAVDTSQSMSVTDVDQQLSRYELARRRIQAWQPRLREKFDVKLARFADVAVATSSVADLPDRATGRATSLVEPLRAAMRWRRGRELAGVVLFSDGQHNAAGAPDQEARRLGAPLYVVGTGNLQQDRRPDLSIVEFEHADRFVVDNRARVTAHVEGTALKGQVTSVILEEDGRQVASATAVIDDRDGPQPVTLEFTPSTKGIHRYTVRVPALSTERITQNNSRAATIRVIDSRIRVLYVEGTLRPEYGAITGRFLAKDPNVEYCALIQTRPNVFTLRTNMDGIPFTGLPTSPDHWKLFDVILLGDLDASFLSAAQAAQLEQRIRDGAGLLAMGGYHALGPGGYSGTPLEELLPVFVGPRTIGQVTEPFVPQLTPDGRNHPIFANIATFFPQPDQPAEIEGLPPLLGCVRVAGRKPSATVLAQCPAAIAGTDEPMPVLAVQPFGKGRTAVFTGDTTRNWQQTLRALDEESPFLRFWGQMVRWLAGRSGDVASGPSLTAEADRVLYEVNQPVTISAIVRDEEGAGTAQANVTAHVRVGSRTRVVNLSPVAGSSGRYQTVLDPLPPGEYRIKCSARFDDVKLESEEIPVEVGRANQEFDHVTLNERLLQDMAAAAGGRYTHIRTADQVLDWLQRDEYERTITAEFRLYWPPLNWLLIVAAVTTEWVYRRRFRLR